MCLVFRTMFCIWIHAHLNQLEDIMFTKQLLFFLNFLYTKPIFYFLIIFTNFILSPHRNYPTVCVLKVTIYSYNKRTIIISLLYHMFWYFHNTCLTSVHIIRTLTPQQIILVRRGLNFSKLNLSRLYILNNCYSLQVPIFYKGKYDQIICLLALYVSIWMSNK